MWTHRLGIFIGFNRTLLSSQTLDCCSRGTDHHASSENESEAYCISIKPRRVTKLSLCLVSAYTICHTNYHAIFTTVVVSTTDGFASTSHFLLFVIYHGDVTVKLNISTSAVMQRLVDV